MSDKTRPTYQLTMTSDLSSASATYESTGNTSSAWDTQAQIGGFDTYKAQYPHAVWSAWPTSPSGTKTFRSLAVIRTKDQEPWFIPWEYFTTLTHIFKEGQIPEASGFWSFEGVRAKSWGDAIRGMLASVRSAGEVSPEDASLLAELTDEPGNPVFMFACDEFRCIAAKVLDLTLEGGRIEITKV